MSAPTADKAHVGAEAETAMVMALRELLDTFTRMDAIEKGMQFYNPNHDAKGRFAPGGGSHVSSGDTANGSAYHGLIARHTAATQRVRQADAAHQRAIQDVRQRHGLGASGLIVGEARNDPQLVAARAEQRAAHAERQQVTNELSKARGDLAETYFASPDDVGAASQHVFGRALSNEEMRSLVGAPADASVTVTTPDRESLHIQMSGHLGQNGQDGDYYAEREVSKAGRSPVLENQLFVIEGETGKGYGSRIFAEQVRNASALGVRRIETTGARAPHMNGYYTWPRLGYETELDASTRSELPATLRNATHISDLMKTQEGRDWWKANGETTAYTFDLRTGSQSRRVLDAYMAAKAQESAKATEMKRPTGSASSRSSEEITLTPEDEAILDRVWAVIAGDTHTLSEAGVVTAPDSRRITEADPDFQRVRGYWLRRLMASVRTLQRDIRRGGEAGISAAQSAFIHRHTTLLRDAYLAAHREGQRDYWCEVSLTPAKWARVRRVTPTVRQVQQRLLFYGAASVVKLAREVAAVAATQRVGHTIVQQTHAQQQPRTGGATLAELATLADPPADLAWNKFTAWASPRIGLQADITWSGFQDGYVDAASADAAGLKLQLWWELGEVKTDHCEDCPQFAAGSPYDAPGSGGNELAATPGDGHTACGANCKCGLRYGWTSLTGLGTGLSSENELLLPPNMKPLVPDNWEARRQAAIDQALQAQQPGGSAGTATWPERDEAIARALQGQQGGTHSTAWPERDEAIAAVGGVYGMPRPGGEYAPGQIDTTRVETAGGEVSLTRDMVRVTTGDEAAEAQALAGLNAGQKQALDDIRGLALLWDATRGALPSFEVYFNPDATSNLWQNRDLAGLTPTQRELVERYFRALGAFADHSPLVDDGN